MMDHSGMKWEDVFDNVIRTNSNGSYGNNTLSQLLQFSDMKISDASFVASFQDIEKHQKDVLEVGCGTGPFLYLFYENGSNVYGIDTSEEAIACCKANMPRGHFKLTQADAIDFNKKFDVILSNSVFQYFDDISYAYKVILSILKLLKPNGICIITDLFDIKKKDEYIKFRKKEAGLTDKQWEQRYASVKHIYYDKDKLKRFIEDLGYVVTIKSPSLLQSDHQQFRFDLMISKSRFMTGFMKTKIFILTYDRPKALNAVLSSLFVSDAKRDIAKGNIEIFIINNFSKLHIEPKYRSKVKILDNCLRLDKSTGHMSRNWNQALLLGFQNLISPKADIVITLQDDVLLQVNWFERTKILHKKFSFIQNGYGDAFCSYTVDAVRKVGLWDERFLMGAQAADYFYRQLMFNWDGCTINDPKHERLHNLIVSDNTHYSTFHIVSNSQIAETQYPDPTSNTDIAIQLIRYKYGNQAIYPWNDQNKNAAKNLKFAGYNFIFYPYFELDMDMTDKAYMT